MNDDHIPLVVVVVLNYGLADDTIACVGSLEKTIAQARLGIIVVDNGSDKSTQAKLQTALNGRTHLLWNDRNLGYAGGNNIGIRAALLAGADYVVILNNDTMVDSFFIQALLNATGRWPERSIFTSKILYLSMPGRIWCAGGIVRAKTGELTNRGFEEEDRGQYEQEASVDFFSGCAVMFSRAAFEEAGGFDEWLFNYCEDVDLSMRLRSLGYSIVYVPKSIVYHKVSKTSGDPVAPRKMYYILRNRKVVFRRYPWTSPSNFWRSEINLTMRCLAIGAKHLQVSLIRAVIFSTVQGLLAILQGRGHRPNLRRVVLVDYSWRGGIAQYTNRLASALADRGWAVWVCVNQQTKFPANPSFTPCPIFRPVRTKKPGNAVERYWKNALLLLDYFANAHSLNRLLRKVRPQVLHFQSVMVPGFDARRIPRLRRWAPNLLLTLHNLAPHDKQSSGINKRLQRLYQQFDHVFVHAKANRSDLQRFLQSNHHSHNKSGCRVPRFHVTPLPALLPVLDPSDAARRNARLSLGVEPQLRLVLFLGQAKPYKGLDVLIRAFARIAPLVPEARLAIVGPCDDFASYEALLREGGLQERVYLRLMFVDEDEAARWLAAADLIALPHREITQSGVAADAVAAGRAVVASALGGIPEIVREGENGKLVTPGDPDALRSALLDLLSNPQMLTRMGEASAKIAREEQSWALAARIAERVYLGLDGPAD